MVELFAGRVKICGITNLDDALAAVDCGVRTLGFAFYPPSSRAVTIEQAQRVIAALPSTVACVGVFVDELPERVQQVANACGLAAAQWHGSEPNAWLAAAGLPAIKAWRARPGVALDLAAYPAAAAHLVDAWSPTAMGGTGQSWDWSLVAGLPRQGKPLVLAGGLTPETVGTAIRQVRPDAVDASSGVESAPGRKNHDRLRRFVMAVREAYDDLERN